MRSLESFKTSENLLANSVKISLVQTRHLFTLEQDTYHVKTLKLKLLTMNKKPLVNSRQILDNLKFSEVFFFDNSFGDDCTLLKVNGIFSPHVIDSSKLKANSFMFAFSTKLES